jgi:hypothetical protein
VFARDELPWTFNGAHAEGYAIALESASPAPGTPLRAGDDLEIAVALRFELTRAERGVVMLVFQDEQDRSIAAGGQPQVLPVTKGSGGVRATQKIRVPAGVRELRVFIPLAPEGAEETHGEVVIRYPILAK